MVDMSAISGLVLSLRAATDISKAMIGLRDAAMIQGKIVELQGVILSAQQSALSAQADQFTLLERVRELEKQIADVEAWEQEKQRYELVELYAGGLAYRIKELVRGSEPPHFICAACYQKRQKSLLQGSDFYSQRTLTCPDCKTEVIQYQGGAGNSPARVASDYDPFS
jgi:hypothetical protein